VIEVRFEDEAQRDALEAFDWYEGERAGLGFAFLESVDAAVLRIEREPLAFAIVYRELRRVLVHRFPYAIYFRVFPNQISVVAVVHGRRHPRIWQQRG
jgi:plasmid stabilization system protein ParE